MKRYKTRTIQICEKFSAAIAQVFVLIIFKPIGQIKNTTKKFFDFQSLKRRQLMAPAVQ